MLFHVLGKERTIIIISTIKRLIFPSRKILKRTNTENKEGSQFYLLRSSFHHIMKNIFQNGQARKMFASSVVHLMVMIRFCRLRDRTSPTDKNDWFRSQINIKWKFESTIFDVQVIEHELPRPVTFGWPWIWTFSARISG